MRGLDFRVERADHIVQHLDADVVPPHAGARTARVLVLSLKDLKGPEPAGRPGFPQVNHDPSPGKRRARPGPRRQLTADTWVRTANQWYEHNRLTLATLTAHTAGVTGGPGTPRLHQDKAPCTPTHTQEVSSLTSAVGAQAVSPGP